MKRALKVATVGVGVGVVALIAISAWVRSQMVASNGDRIVVSPTVTGVLEKYAYVWIVRTTHGAALIDAGPSVTGDAVLAELAAQKLHPEDIHTLLITHGHGDHWAAAAKFPKARVYVGAADAPFIRGEAHYMPTLVEAVMSSHAQVPPLTELTGDQTLDVDGLSIRVIPLPGHTPGSVAYLLGDLLFTGDSVMRSKDALAMGPWLFSTNAKQNRESLRKLLGLDFRRIADGHGGLTEDAKTQLAAFLR